ncbi:membrane protein [Actibacterium mucosum KCTC 23349]|uniref:Membrane protein n=1 Tax=Actibacterium mucosum KCTC 23349 TaxID=1454373 RepID=A0A037ZHE2_9RHOB|nr:cell envelope integrity protein CreD [Actibacterium mucosum]KAJ55039.1 membrane protein [Actibacterium mucosum KCTC 23349]
MRSAGFRFFVVGLLGLLMFIPLFFAGDIVDSRARYSREVNQSVGQEWGGAQTLRGPQLVIPVSKTVTQTRKETITDPATGEAARDPVSGEARFRVVEEQVEQKLTPIYLLPDRFDVQIDATTQIRSRGIFDVPVYQAEAVMQFTFNLDRARALLDDGQYAKWEGTTLRVALSSNRSLRGQADLSADGSPLSLEPFSRDNRLGITSALGDPQGMQAFTLRLGLNGAHGFRVAPVGRTSVVDMTSDWPDPSFTGAFLPDERTVSDAGFQARWTIPHLARSQPEVARADQLAKANVSTFGVELIQPNDFYQKAYRVANYGILFIALTFLTVLLVEPRGGTPTHPVQYLLIGLMQALFVVLMVAYAEHIGFGAAYALSAGAVVLVLTMYGFVGLRLGKRALVLGAVLSVLYALVYLILRSADFALLAGSTLVFAALAGTMFATRNEQWYGPDGPGRGLLRRRPKPETPKS